jgi:hypothetical protein
MFVNVPIHEKPGRAASEGLKAKVDRPADEISASESIMRTTVILGFLIILWGCCRSSDQDFHARSWSRITLPSLDSASVTLHTAWREGKMSWTLVIVPAVGRLKNPLRSGKGTGTNALWIRIQAQPGQVLAV